MEQVELFLVFTVPLEERRIDYMATGSVASMLYGIPRFTNDLDLVVDVKPRQGKSLVEAYPEAEFYRPPEEVLQIEIRRGQRGHFNVIHNATGFKADMYIHGSDPLEAWGLARRTRIDLSEGRGLSVAAPEYVIVRKLEYYREGGSDKHLHDIRGMLEVSAEIIDGAAVVEWVERRGLQAEWALVSQ